MSDYRDSSTTTRLNQSKLYICLFASQGFLGNSVVQTIDRERYELKHFEVLPELAQFITNNYEQIDCLLLSVHPELESVTQELWQSEIFLPSVIIETQQATENLNPSQNSLAQQPHLYHQAEIRLYLTQLEEINSYISLAISKFINLAPNSKLGLPFRENLSQESAVRKSLVSQQRRLTDKLKERLGYLGVYYKRNPEEFFANLDPEQQRQLLKKLNQGYRSILLDYFDDNSKINQLIDEFVDQVFFADISTAQILEIHMELIDDFSHQLRIEGRNDDILLDYRLPLIDVISHLCEMYRRSIPGSTLSSELLFTVE